MQRNQPGLFSKNNEEHALSQLRKQSDDFRHMKKLCHTSTNSKVFTQIVKKIKNAKSLEEMREATERFNYGPKDQSLSEYIMPKVFNTTLFLGGFISSDLSFLYHAWRFSEQVQMIMPKDKDVSPLKVVNHEKSMRI